MSGYERNFYRKFKQASVVSWCAFKDKIKQELSEMEQQGIITPVREGEPTAWVNSLVYHRKPSGKIRVCLDPKDLNKAIL